MMARVMQTEAIMILLNASGVLLYTSIVMLVRQDFKSGSRGPTGFGGVVMKAFRGVCVVVVEI